MQPRTEQNSDAIDHFGWSPDRLGHPSIPDYQTLMLPVLRLAAGGEQRVADVVDRVADEFGLSQEQREMLLPSGRQRVLQNRIHWAKSYLSKAGLISSPGRSRFVATEEGRKLLATNPDRIDVALLMKQPSFREFYKNEREPASDGVDAVFDGNAPKSASVTPTEQIEAAYLNVQKALRADLLERIAQNPPAFLERLVVDLLVAMGYAGSHKSAASHLGRSGDGGVDGVIEKDQLGLDQVYVQVKRFGPGNAVGRPDVQAFVGSLDGRRATKGVFVTASTFSREAREYVQHSSKRIILIDGQSLADLMIEHGVGVRTSQAIEFKRLDEDFFSKDDWA